MDDRQSKVEAIWSGAEVEIAKADDRESREAMREEYIRDAVWALDSPEHGGYVGDFSEVFDHANDRFERQYLKRAFKRLLRRGELVKVKKIGDRVLYRLV